MNQIQTWMELFVSLEKDMNLSSLLQAIGK